MAKEQASGCRGLMRAEAKRGAVSPLLRDLFRWPDAAFAAHSQPHWPLKASSKRPHAAGSLERHEPTLIVVEFPSGEGGAPSFVESVAPGLW